MAFRSVGFQEAAEQLKAWGNAVLPSPRPTTPQTSPKNAVRESTFAKSPRELARRLASQHCPDGPVRDHNTHYQENQLRYRHRTISPAWGNTTTLPTNRASKSRSRWAGVHPTGGREIREDITSVSRSGSDRCVVSTNPHPRIADLPRPEGALALSPRWGISAVARQESPVLVDDDGTIGRPDTRRDIPNPIRKE